MQNLKKISNDTREIFNKLLNSYLAETEGNEDILNSKKDELLKQLGELFFEVITLEYYNEAYKHGKKQEVIESKNTIFKLLQNFYPGIYRFINNSGMKDRYFDQSVSELPSVSLSLFEDFPILIWKSNTDAKCNYFNTTWLEFTGRTLEQEMGDGWAEGVHPDDLENCINTYLNAFNCRQPFKMEYRMRRYDGEYRWIHNLGRPFTDHKGNFVGYIGGCFDITERIQTENLLEKYKLISTSTRDIVLFLAEDGKIIEANNAAVILYGYSREDLLNMTIYDIQGVRLRGLQIKSLINTQMNQAISDGILFETLHYRKDGSSFPVEVSSRGMTSNNTTYLICIIRDITERKAMETKLKDSNGQLQFLSFHDQLTGVYNRSYFEMKIQEYDKDIFSAMGLIICYINGLKLVNDALGYVNGDLILKEAANIVIKCTKDIGLAARINGDEFAVILPDCTEMIIENIINMINEMTENYNKSNPHLYLSITSGYAIRKNGNMTTQELFKIIENEMIAEKLYKSENIQYKISNILINTLEDNNKVTKEHSYRLQECILLLSDEIDLRDTSPTHLQYLAKFHDIGKIRIPDEILNKPYPLTQKEMDIIKNHCISGYRIALSMNSLAPISDWILKHHERWDGKGYPLGIKEDEIPLACRIFSVLDAYDAMVGQRPYRKAISHQKAVVELEKHAGTQFDPMVIDSLIKVLNKYNKKAVVP